MTRMIAVYSVLLAMTASLNAGDLKKKAVDREAFKAIHKAGGNIFCDYEGTPLALTISYAVKDIKTVVDRVKYFPELESIWYVPDYGMNDEILTRLVTDAPKLKKLWAGGMGDTGLKIIAKGKNIENLRIGSRTITDAGMAHLTALPKLRELHVSGFLSSKGFEKLAPSKTLEFLWYTQVNDESLKGIAKITSLKRIRFVRAAVTDKGFQELASLPNLEELNFQGTKISDVAVTRLGTLQKLRELNLNDTKITDESLKTLGKLKSLRRLCLERTKISDVGLSHLVGMANLETIDLGGTPITDNGIVQLAGIKKLRLVSLGGAAVTPKGRSMLVHLRPKILITDVGGPFPSKDEP
ncbi:MAG: hypothetical protein HYX68_06955 [Planctomycetes bacterium]|nr:hypothetical protein [Planctomycetota bacterium]